MLLIRRIHHRTIQDCRYCPQLKSFYGYPYAAPMSFLVEAEVVMLWRALYFTAMTLPMHPMRFQITMTINYLSMTGCVDGSRRSRWIRMAITGLWSDSCRTINSAIRWIWVCCCGDLYMLEYGTWLVPGQR